MKILLTYPAVGVFTFSLVCAIALGTSPSPRLALPSKADYAKITTAVRGDDLTVIPSAVAQIRTWINGQRVSPDLAFKWLPALMVKQRYQDVADLAFSGLTARPEAKFLDRLPLLRAKALIALNKPDDALQTAKSFYNACSMGQTTAAIDLLEVCLVKAHPDDPALGHRFRTEQILAAGGENGVGSSIPATTILKSISFDAAPYADALTFWKQKAANGKFNDMASYANVLLLADRAADAEKIFRELFQVGVTQEELDTATEGIAKALRAEDGNVGRANAWLLSLSKTSGDQKASAAQSPSPTLP